MDNFNFATMDKRCMNFMQRLSMVAKLNASATSKKLDFELINKLRAKKKVGFLVRGRQRQCCW